MSMFFHKGDIVRVRQWEDMKEEYGEDYDGCINTIFSFVELMRRFCGTEVEVMEVRDTTWLGRQCQEIVCGLSDRFAWSNEMFEFAHEQAMVGIESIDDLI